MSFEIKCYEMHFCGSSLHFSREAYCRNHNSYNIICIEKRVRRGHRVCKDNKRRHEPKKVEKHCIRIEGTALRQVRPSQSGPRAKLISHPLL